MTAPAPKEHNLEISGIVKRMLNILTEQDTLAEDLKELKAEAKAKGMNAKALALALKEHRAPIDEDIKQLANTYFKESGGNYDLFA